MSFKENHTARQQELRLIRLSNNPAIRDVRETVVGEGIYKGRVAYTFSVVVYPGVPSKGVRGLLRAKYERSKSPASYSMVCIVPMNGLQRNAYSGGLIIGPISCPGFATDPQLPLEDRIASATNFMISGFRSARGKSLRHILYNTRTGKPTGLCVSGLSKGICPIVYYLEATSKWIRGMEQAKYDDSTLKTFEKEAKGA